jgi:hypothetical protein
MRENNPPPKLRRASGARNETGRRGDGLAAEPVALNARLVRPTAHDGKATAALFLHARCCASPPPERSVPNLGGLT